MAISIDNLRVGMKYHIENYGEIADFEILEKSGENDFKVKDLNTLETYQFRDLIKYGMSENYELHEINTNE